MLTRFRNWAARKLLAGTPYDPAAKAPQTTVAKGISAIAATKIADYIATAARDSVPKTPDYAWPELPPGVRPAKPLAADDPGLLLAVDEAPDTGQLAMDDGATFNWLNGFGNLGCGLSFPGYPYLANLTQISEYRSPCEVMSTEMTRKWMKLVTKGKSDEADKIEQLDAWFTKHQIRDKFRRAALQDAQFGRSQIYIEIKGQDNDAGRQKPLMIDDKGGVGRDSVKNLQVIEAYWTTPYSYNADRPEQADFYIPQSWYVMGRKTHTTRLLSFVGREVPDLLKPAYNFGGISLIQLLELTVNMWLRTRKSVNDLINVFSMVTLSTDMNATLAGGNGDDVVSRTTLFTKFRSNLGLLLLNKDTEELNQQAVPLGTLDKLQAQSQEHMAAVSHIPLIKLFGVVPTGLNATGEGEIQVWYDFVRAYQENLFGPNLDIVLKLAQLDLFGAIDETIAYEWVSLDEPTAKELSEMRKADSERDTGYVNAGIVSPDEVREKLQLDPESGYSNLSGPAPEPEMDPALEGEGEEGDAPPEADPAEAQGAQHKHEADQAELDRKHEMAVTKLKVAKK
jgi:phage-related protein (TIGR01555 family)